MQILTTEAEIRAAIATMNPVARVAAQNLAGYLLENPATLQNQGECNRAFVASVAFAMQQAGWDTSNDRRVHEFFENHGEAVSNVSISIVCFAVDQAERRRKWGWLGKAGAFVAGAFLSSLFG